MPESVTCQQCRKSTGKNFFFLPRKSLWSELLDPLGQSLLLLRTWRGKLNEKEPPLTGCSRGVQMNRFACVSPHSAQPEERGWGDEAVAATFPGQNARETRQEQSHRPSLWVTRSTCPQSPRLHSLWATATLHSCHQQVTVTWRVPLCTEEGPETQGSSSRCPRSGRPGS